MSPKQSELECNAAIFDAVNKSQPDDSHHQVQSDSTCDESEVGWREFKPIKMENTARN